MLTDNQIKFIEEIKATNFYKKIVDKLYISNEEDTIYYSSKVDYSSSDEYELTFIKRKYQILFCDIVILSTSDIINLKEV